MRFVWAVMAFVLAAVLIGAGIAQRTVFMGPASLETRVEVKEQAPFVLIDAGVLMANSGTQKLSARGSDEVFVGYGRTADLRAWLADADYNHVTVAKNGSLKVTHVPAGASPGTREDHSPVGSDLLLDSFSGKGSITADNLQLPEGMSVLIASDGTQDAPNDILVSWPLDTSTPWAGPLMAAGGSALLVGLILYVLGIRYQRRGRGPRRKGPGPLPDTEPILLSALPSAERAVAEADVDSPDPESGEATEAVTMKMIARPTRRRWMLALPAVGVIAVLTAGCSAESWPRFGSTTPSASPSPTVIAPENQKPPAVTESQAKHILNEISDTVATADADLDLDLAKTRLDGAALAARTTEYALRKALPDTKAPAAIPTQDVQVILPEATDRWPRTVLMVSRNKAKDAPQVLLTMTQADPWTTYKVTSVADVQANNLKLNVAAAWLGTSLVPSDSAFLSISPGEVATAFADVVDAGEKSASYGRFDEQSVALAKAITASRQDVVKMLAEKGAAATSRAAFDMTPFSSAPVALTTLDSGAIVSVAVIDTQRVTPRNRDVSIRIKDNAQAKALTGVTESKTGFESTYLIQLYFSVPAQGSSEQIRLLGYHQDLLGEKVIK